jgi:hypothetical protein
VKGQISPSYAPTRKVIVLCVFSTLFAFSDRRREPTGRISVQDEDRQFTLLLPGLWRLIWKRLKAKGEVVPVYAVKACRGI